MKPLRFPSGVVTVLAVGLAWPASWPWRPPRWPNRCATCNLAGTPSTRRWGSGAGGHFTLSGASQASQTTGPMSGGVYTLDGGFWPGARYAALYQIYLPLVLRNAP